MTNFPKTVMLLGSGELGKEVAIAAQRLGCHVIACDRYAGAPAMQVADQAEVLTMTDPNALKDVVNKHQPDVERQIRSIKDRTRSTYTMLPFRHIPRVMLIHLVRNAVLWMNALPADDGVWLTVSVHLI